MKKSITTLSSLIFITVYSFGQPGGTPVPRPGMCLVQSVTPEVYEMVEKRILVKPSYKHFVVVPAEFRTVEERVVLRPASKQYINVPAEFQTITEEMQVEDPSSIVKVIEPKFSINNEIVEVRPVSGSWEYKYAMENCQSRDPRDCMILQYVQQPPAYKSIPVQALEQTASFTRTPQKGQTKTIQRQIVVKEASVREVEIPAEYALVTRRILVKDEEVKEVVVPAEYRVEMVQILKDKGGLPVWEEVDCRFTEYRLLPVSFSTGSAVLSADDQRIIDDLLFKLMQEKPSLKVEIASHTDSRGSAADNEKLSRERANAVADYLYSKGILNGRLVAKGFGESRLKNRCSDGVPCSETEHAQNRRIEFRVLSN